MEPQCDSSCAQVNPDASHLVARPAESGTAFAVEHGFPGHARSAGTGGRPPAPTPDEPHDCRHPSSTAARDRTAGTPPPGIRICRSTAIVRRPWARCLSHGPTSMVQVELKSPILFTGGARPPWRQRARLLHRFGPAAGFFSATDYRPARSLPCLLRSPTPDLDHSTTITCVHHKKAAAVSNITDPFDSRPRLMTLSSHTEPHPTAGITRLLDTVHNPPRGPSFSSVQIRLRRRPGLMPSAQKKWRRNNPILARWQSNSSPGLCDSCF